MITVVGSSNTDFTIKADRFPSVGETVLGGDFFICGGGKGANQAACIAKLGGRVNFISNIGWDEFGRARAEELRRLGVATGGIKKDKVNHSGVAFIIVDKNARNLITVSPGSNGFLRPKDISGRKSPIKKSNILLLQLEIPLDTVKEALKTAKKYKKISILNAAPARPLGCDILSKVDILVVNEVELSMLSGITHASFVKSARTLLKNGISYIVVTLGKEGALLVSDKKERFFKAKKVKAVDTTCAGDAFCGALAFALDDGKSIEEAIEFANCIAALTCTKLGAQSSLPTAKQACNFFLR